MENWKCPQCGAINAEQSWTEIESFVDCETCGTQHILYKCPKISCDYAFDPISDAYPEDIQVYAQ